MKRITIFFIIFIIINGCSTVSMTEIDKESLKTVSIEYSVINKLLEVTCHRCSFTWAGPYQGKDYFDNKETVKAYQNDGLTKLHEDVYLNNDIDIKQIVYNELIEQLTLKSKFYIVSEDPDFIIRPVIEMHGYGQPSIFSLKLSPKIVVSLHGDINGQKDAFISKGIVTIFSKYSESHSNYDLVHNPQLIIEGYKLISEKAISDALESILR
ncbi:MAG: hypothetical protein AB2801_11315 [Candidatus Thiodiazotropha endolucinida]